MQVGQLPQEAWLKEDDCWAVEKLSIDDAICLELLPSILKKIKVSHGQRTKSEIRMYVAKFVADKMTSESLSRQEMSDILEKDDYWSSLCKKVEDKYPTAKWIENIAPLFGGGKIIERWEDKQRYKLIPVLKNTIALGIIRCSRGTDHFTFVSFIDQGKVFRKYCLEVQKGNTNKKALDDFLRLELDRIKDRQR